MSKKPIHFFSGDKMDVSWDERLCIHIAECGQAKDDIFIAGRDPWCIPDLALSDAVEEIIKRCPSGALSFAYKDGTAETLSVKENKVTVVYNGPLYVQGDLEINGAKPDMVSVKFRAALCRCGASRNKPFCDNSHIEINFQDYAAVGEKGESLDETDGQLTVSTIKDGPLMFKGNFSIYAGSGRLAWQGEKAALCRCGASKNKPFCDGSHKAAGFNTD